MKTLDILVNNAGIYQRGLIETLSLDDFEKTMAINVRAVFVAIKAVLPLMPDEGRIISIGSTLADHVSKPGLSLYTASKAAIKGLTQALARELGPRHITVNIIHVGSTNTEPSGWPKCRSLNGLNVHSAFIWTPAKWLT